MSEYYKLEEVDQPTDAQLLKRRETKHADHLGYFYGDHWNIFIDKENKCFLEFDIGHFSSEFIIREITHESYNLLKNDKSLFEKISRNVR